MDVKRFNSLDLNSKGNVMHDCNGKYIATRNYHNFKIKLYDCGDFFAEVFYSIEESQITKIEGIADDSPIINLYIGS
jgi:hypothetical protein